MHMKINGLPKLNNILAFKIAAEGGSLSKAASVLALTPAAISQQIRQLESHLGKILFVRNQNGVKLTEAGINYLGYINEAFNILNVAQQSFNDELERSKIIIHSLPALATGWLTPALETWYKKHPNVEVIIHATQSHFDFSNSTADFTVCFGNHNLPQLEKDFLFNDHVIAVCNPELAKKYKEPSRFPLINIDWGLESRFLPGWDYWFAAKGLSMSQSQFVLTVNLTSLAIDAAVQGYGFLLGQKKIIEHHIKKGSLIIVDPLAIPLLKPYFLAYSKKVLNDPISRSMHDWMMNLAK